MEAASLLLKAIGEPPREGLEDTPARVAKAWIDDWTWGYDVDPLSVLKSFKDGAAGYDELVMETNIPVYSKCEHHMADIFGVAHVAYIPDGRVVGLSKIARVVEIFARRLQVQERLTVQVADTLMAGLVPRGVAVMLQCRHMCMESRGVNRPGVVTSTVALRGVFATKPEARAEFMSLVNGRRVV